ncbi:EAL domain-containing protein [Rugamonas sp.]|uniref:EAL domain-containing protein n=1 Tax=Rugamonas sp. TaxID=1926287 RepID=UPI0025EF6585|nr:EAL domain-containing protein [Rugamonas sp.]
MSFPVLQNYLARLSDAGRAATSIWLDADGKAQGRFFNSTMSSAFQPVRRLDDGRVLAYEGLARGVAAADQGLSLWRLLDHAASDDESIELDRLCRMLHAINFFRQHAADDGADLYLSVHARLLSAVGGNHGHAFQRILDALALPTARIVLQLPQVTAQQGWLLNYVADNYRRNGFRYAINAAGPGEALALLDRVRPAVVKLDARHFPSVTADAADAAAHAAHAAHAVTLLRRCAGEGVRVVFKRLDSAATLTALRAIAGEAGVALLAQGHLLDQPHAVLLAPDRPELAPPALYG